MPGTLSSVALRLPALQLVMPVAPTELTVRGMQCIVAVACAVASALPMCGLLALALALVSTDAVGKMAAVVLVNLVDNKVESLRAMGEKCKRVGTRSVLERAKEPECVNGNVRHPSLPTTSGKCPRTTALSRARTDIWPSSSARWTHKSVV